MLSILKLLNKKKKKFFISIVQVIGILASFYFFIRILNFLPFTKGKYGSVLKEFIKIDMWRFLIWFVSISLLMFFVSCGFLILFDLLNSHYGKNAITCILLNKKIFFYLAILFTCICSLEKDNYCLIVTTLSFIEILFFTNNQSIVKMPKNKKHRK